MKNSEVTNKPDDSLPKWFWLCAGVIILSKLLLIGNNEIVAIPYDSLEYIRQAANGIYSIGPTPKGYPIWLWITNFFGAPQRLVIELLYLSSSLMLAYFIGRVVSGKVGLFVLLFLAWSPNSFFLFDRALSDGFYMCLTLIGVALSISIIYTQHGSRSYWIKTLTLGFALGLMLITRNEEPLILAWVMWLALLLWFFVWNRESRLFTAKVKFAFSFIGTLAIAAYGLAGAVLLMHYLTNGVAAGSLATLPSHIALLKNLARIDTNEESVRFVPITKKAREMAYAESPTFRELKLIIESPDNPYQVVSSQHHLPQGEIGAGWIWHVFNNAAFSKAGNQGVQGIDASYRKINQELENAFSNGSLHQKFLIHPLLGSNLSAGMPFLASSLFSVVDKSLSAIPFQPDMGIEPSLFDRVCLRRTALSPTINRQPFQGWVILDTHRNARIKSVQIETESNQSGAKETSRTNAEEMLRKDVVDGYAKAEGRVPTVYGYRAQMSEVRGEPKKIIYILSDGHQIEVDAPFSKGMSTIDVSDNRIKITQGLDLTGEAISIQSSSLGFQIQNKLISLIERPTVKIVIGIIDIGGILLSLIQMSRRKAVPFQRWSLLVIFISGIMLFRILFYALLDAAAWPVELRYLAPANSLLIVIFALVMAEVGRRFWGLFQKLILVMPSNKHELKTLLR